MCLCVLTDVCVCICVGGEGWSPISGVLLRLLFSLPLAINRNALFFSVPYVICAC